MNIKKKIGLFAIIPCTLIGSEIQQYEIAVVPDMYEFTAFEPKNWCFSFSVPQDMDILSLRSVLEQQLQMHGQPFIISGFYVGPSHVRDYVLQQQQDGGKQYAELNQRFGVDLVLPLPSAIAPESCLTRAKNLLKLIVFKVKRKFAKNS